MDPVSIASLSLRGASGLVNGISQAVTSYDRFTTQKKELQMQADALNEQLDYIQSSYDNNMAQLNASLENALSQNSSAYRSTLTARGNAASMASFSNTESQALAYSELASLQEQGLASVGTAVQSVASSGFRMSDEGTTGNTVEEAVAKATEAYDASLRQIRASAYQSYMQATAAYSDSSLRMESYREAMRTAQENYDLQSEALTDEYEYNTSTVTRQRDYIQGQINAMGEWEWWDEGIRDFFGGLFGI